MRNWSDRILNISTNEEFNACALDAFSWQYANVSIYKRYCDALKKNPKNVTNTEEIPFLPIEFFKSHSVLANNLEVEAVFTSSGTTGMQTSKHLVADLAVYEGSFLKAFERYYGAPNDYCILALLPSYLERGGSSLVYMADRLIKESKHSKSGFYLNDYEALVATLTQLNNSKQKVLLLGVTYALLDLAEQNPMQLNNTIVMETGGMKGRRKEMIREELHDVLCAGLGVENIHSEYGMTELLSQGYSYGKGVFTTPPWMKILIRDTYDPLSYQAIEKSGGINVIDLANINSCCFIETKDLGKIMPDNAFTILGRFDQSDVRGCNLMVAD